MIHRETASDMYPSACLLTGALLAQYLGLIFLGSFGGKKSTFAPHRCAPKRSRRRVCSPAPAWMQAQCGYARRRILKSRPLSRGASNHCGPLPYPAMLRSCFMLRSGRVTIPTCYCDWCMQYRVGCEQGGLP